MDLEQYDIQANNPCYDILSVSSGYFPYKRFHHQNILPPHSQLKIREITPHRAPIFSKIPLPLLKKPVNSSFSVRVENTFNYCAVCKNTAVSHLSCWLPTPLQSSCFLPPTLPHRNPQTLSEHECEDNPYGAFSMFHFYLLQAI